MKKIVLMFAALFIAAAGTAGTIPQYLVMGNSPSRLEKRAEQELKHFYKAIYGRELVSIP